MVSTLQPVNLDLHITNVYRVIERFKAIRDRGRIDSCNRLCSESGSLERWFIRGETQAVGKAFLSTGSS